MSNYTPDPRLLQGDEVKHSLQGLAELALGAIFFNPGLVKDGIELLEAAGESRQRRQ